MAGSMKIEAGRVMPSSPNELDGNGTERNDPERNRSMSDPVGVKGGWLGIIAMCNGQMVVVLCLTLMNLLDIPAVPRIWGKVPWWILFSVPQHAIILNKHVSTVSQDTLEFHDIQ